MGSGPEASPAFPVLIYLGTSLRDLSDFLCSHAAEKRIGVTMHGGGRGNCPRPDSRVYQQMLLPLLQLSTSSVSLFDKSTPDGLRLTEAFSRILTLSEQPEIPGSDIYVSYVEVAPVYLMFHGRSRAFPQILQAEPHPADVYPPYVENVPVLSAFFPVPPYPEHPFEIGASLFKDKVHPGILYHCPPYVQAFLLPETSQRESCYDIFCGKQCVCRCVSGRRVVGDCDIFQDKGVEWLYVQFFETDCSIGAALEFFQYLAGQIRLHLGSLYSENPCKDKGCQGDCRQP